MDRPATCDPLPAGRPAAARVRRRRPGSLLAALLLLGLLPAPSSAFAEETIPLFVMPIQTGERALKQQASVFFEALNSSLLATGRFSIVAGGEAGSQVDQAVQQCNKEAVDPTCWIRIGFGKGARKMVAGTLQGKGDACYLTLRLVDIETRLEEKRIFDAYNCKLNDLLNRAESYGKRLMPAGSIRVATEPEEVKVYLDAELKGKSPLQIQDVPPGEHALRLTLEGYAEAARKVQVQEGKVEVVQLKLERTTGTLEIRSTPAGARVTVDHQERGVTPLTLDAISAGPHGVEVALPRYRPWSSPVQVDTGATLRVEASLVAEGQAEAPAPAPMPPTQAAPAALAPPSAPSAVGFGRFEVTLFTPESRAFSAADERLLNELERLGFRVSRTPLKSNPDPNIKVAKGQRAVAEKVWAVVNRYYRGSFAIQEMFSEGDGDLFVNLGAATEMSATPGSTADATQHRVTIFTPGSHAFGPAETTTIARLRSVGFQVKEEPGGGGSNPESNVKVGRGNAALGQQVQAIVGLCWGQPFPVQEVFESGDTDIYVNLGADADSKATCR